VSEMCVRGVCVGGRGLERGDLGAIEGENVLDIHRQPHTHMYILLHDTIGAMECV